VTLVCISANTLSAVFLFSSSCLGFDFFIFPPVILGFRDFLSSLLMMNASIVTLGEIM